MSFTQYVLLCPGGQLLLDSKKVATLDEGHERIRKSLYDGTAQASFIDMAIAQGVDKEDAHSLFVAEQREQLLPKAKYTTEFTASSTGKCNLMSWWRHQMETFSALLALCGEFTGDRWIPLTKASDAEL